MFGLSKICNKISSGYCTCFFDKLFGKDWSECCKTHDEEYEKLKQNQSTKESDLAFLKCLKNKT